MLNFDEKKLRESTTNALHLRPEIEKVVDELCEKGFRNLYFLGVGGTWASAMQAVIHMKEKSSIWVESLLSSEYNTTGDRCVGKDSIIVFSSVSGTTSEIVQSVKKAKAAGATIFAFVDNPGTPLCELGDYLISYSANEQLKLFMVADRFMKNAGEFDEYDRYYAELDLHLADVLVETEKLAEDFAEEYAFRHYEDDLHYFIGCGNQYGMTYSHAMCYWEEQHWLRSKSIHSGEFFHGTLEIIDRDTPVTLFIGEDSQRSLSERVARFLPRVSANYEIIDTKDYPLTGISPEFRGNLSHLIARAINNRIDKHVEQLTCHPMEIRRYYRQLEY